MTLRLWITHMPNQREFAQSDTFFSLFKSKKIVNRFELKLHLNYIDEIADKLIPLNSFIVLMLI